MTSFPAARVLREVRLTGGATFDPSGQQVNTGDLWLFPAFPGRTLILAAHASWERALAQFIGEHQPLVEPEGLEWRAFGAWIHPDGRLYLDIVSGRSSSEAALREAVAAGQRGGRRVVAIYQASTGTTLTLPTQG